MSVKQPKTNKPNTAAADISTTAGSRAPIVSAPAPTKSKRKIHYKEFIAGKGFNRTFLAGFRMFLNGTVYLTAEEWEKTLQQYQNR